jgi:hypothetical protein
MFGKPYIAYKHQDGYPPYPYVENAYTFFNMYFRKTEVKDLQDLCYVEIKAEKEKMFRQKVIAIVEEHTGA